MNKHSRVINSIKNVGIGTLLQLFALVLSFIARSIFVRFLGIEYLSVDGLFSNILTLLNFTELGIGSAIIFSLYKPIAEYNYEQIGALMNLFRKAYQYVATIILVLGLLVIPFLGLIITDVPDVKENIKLLYCLFIINSVFSYVYGYKKSLLIADQKNYVVLLIYQTIHTFQILSQIAILYFTRDYVLFLSVMIGCTLLNNVISTLYVDKKYTWLNSYMKEELSSIDRKTIFGNIKAIVFYKLGSVVLNGTNNIVISTVIRTSLVGFCANYTLIINAVSTVINQGISGLTASIGSYNVNANPIENEKVFRQLDFLLFWMLSFICAGLYCLINDFIAFWLGSEYVLDKIFVVVILASFYVQMANMIPYSYRTAMGLFKNAKFFPCIAALINLVLSILLAKSMGLIGVFIANVIARFLCYTLVDTNLIYKNGFCKSSSMYYIVYVFRILIIIILSLLFSKFLSLIGGVGYMSFICKLLFFVVFYNVLFCLLFWNNKSFVFVRSRLYKSLRKRENN